MGLDNKPENLFQIREKAWKKRKIPFTQNIWPPLLHSSFFSQVGDAGDVIEPPGNSTTNSNTGSTAENLASV